MRWLSTHPTSIRSPVAASLAGSLATQPDRDRSRAFENTTPPTHFSLDNPLLRSVAPTSLNFEWANHRVSAAESNSELPQPTCSGGEASLSHGCGSPAVCWAAPANLIAQLRL